MTTFDLLKEVKSKIEVSTQFDEVPMVVSAVNGDKKEATVIVMKEVEGKIKMIRLQAEVIGEAITA